MSDRRRFGIVNLTDLRAFLGHAGGFKSLIVCIGAGWIRPKYEKFCIKLTIPPRSVRTCW